MLFVWINFKKIGICMDRCFVGPGRSEIDILTNDLQLYMHEHIIKYFPGVVIILLLFFII